MIKQVEFDRFLLFEGERVPDVGVFQLEGVIGMLVLVVMQILDCEKR